MLQTLFFFGSDFRLSISLLFMMNKRYMCMIFFCGFIVHFFEKKVNKPESGKLMIMIYLVLERRESYGKLA